MAQAPRSSFIPKQTKTAVSSRINKKRRFNMLGIISTVLLLSSLVLAGGTYFYRDYSSKQLAEEKQALAAERNRFNESDIARIRELDRKFAAARYLLSNHISPSKVFDALELETKESVQFSSFSFSQLPSGDASLTVRGATEEFKSVALQAFQFEQNNLLTDAVFTGLSNDEVVRVGTGDEDEEADTALTVGFNVTGSIAASLLTYTGRDVPTAVQNENAPAASTATSSDASSEDEESDDDS